MRSEQLHVIAASLAEFQQSGDWREASAILLRAALSQTASEYGFAGVVVDGPVLRILAQEGITWDRATNRDFNDKADRADREPEYLDFHDLTNLFGSVITGGKAVISNDPAHDPRSGDLPPGCPPLRHFLGVPMLRGTEVVGMVVMANRLGGYTISEQAKLELLAQMANVLYDSYRQTVRETSLLEQLRQSQRMQAVGSLAGGIAHDFNNLLLVITGYSELLLTRLQGNDPHRKEVEEIKGAGMRAAALTRQLLSFSRSQGLAPKVLDLSTAVADAHKMLRRLVREEIDLVTELSPDLRRVKIDPVQIDQIIMNLVVNARDAIRGAGKIIVETETVELDEAYAFGHTAVRSGCYAMLAVSDTGCGMDAETQARIFDPFFTTKKPDEGTGLGLSVVYGIVKQNRGNIWVYSEPGRGTTVKVYIPCVEEALKTVEPAKTPTKLPPGTETILLVEDEETVLSLAREVLERQGYYVLATSSVAEALQICELHEGLIHLLLSDVVMPQMNGRDLASLVLALRPATKLLFMSGYPGKLIFHQRMLEASMPYLQKPFTPDALARKVHEVLVPP